MAWANTNGSWNNFDMDSEGKKLTVRSQNATIVGTHRAEIVEEGDGIQHRALKVKGQLAIEQFAASDFHGLHAKGKTLLEALPAQTDEQPVLNTTGNTRVLLDRTAPGTTDGNALEVKGKTQLERHPNGQIAATVDGHFRIHDLGSQIGTFKNGVLGSRRLDINTGPGDANIEIGASGVNGNSLYLKANQIEIGGAGSQVTLNATGGEITVSGAEDARNLVVHGDLEVTNDIHTNEVDATGLGNDMTLGGVNNGGVCRIGRYAQQITLAEQGNGAIVTIRGPVIVNDGTPEHERDASLEVFGSITARGDLGTTGNLSIDGNITSNVTVGTTQQPRTTTLNGALTANGNVTIGTTQQPRTTTLNGQVEVNGGLAIDGALYVDTVKTNNSETVKFSSTVAVEEKLEIEGTSTFNNITAHLAGINFNTAGIIPFNGIRFQNNRFEFYIAGVLQFYIDTDGGHDA